MRISLFIGLWVEFADLGDARAAWTICGYQPRVWAARRAQWWMALAERTWFHLAVQRREAVSWECGVVAGWILAENFVTEIMQWPSCPLADSVG
jgi:hypothetical protein